MQAGHERQNESTTMTLLSMRNENFLHYGKTSFGDT